MNLLNTLVDSCFCLFQLVVNLAIVVYHALDYTHGEDEERLISPDLEGLITEMTAGNITGKLQYNLFLILKLCTHNTVL